MRFARIKSLQLDPGGATPVSVDVERSGIEAGIRIVGLPDKAVQESCARVLAAVRNTPGAKGEDAAETGFITISLAPADLHKTGPTFDLPIAVGLLVTSGVIRADVSNMLFVGELGLSGDLRPIRGALAAALAAKRRNVAALFVPESDAKEAALVDGVEIYGVRNLSDLIAHFAAIRSSDGVGVGKLIGAEPYRSIAFSTDDIKDFAHVRGQQHAKRALAIAAAGGHHVALFGPPGTGKSMLSRAFVELLPPLSSDEAIESTMIHSLSGVLHGGPVVKPPLRSPHHTSSHVAIIGGGPNVRPGEITLAHNGVLFLDEFPEFDTRLIEALREPLENNLVHISRAKGSKTFPARFQLIAAMNPCPCGFAGDRERKCSCSPAALDKYRRRLSGPIVDRIDIWVQVPRPSSEDMLTSETTEEKKRSHESAIELRENVARAYSTALARQGVRNAQLPPNELDVHAGLSSGVKAILVKAAEVHRLSARALHRTVRVARTIADLAGHESIKESDVLEALQYRSQVPS